MKILICGAGRVGFNLARYLSQHENDVTVIDSSSSLISHINDRLEVRAVCGHASAPETLKKAGAEDTDMVIAVTHSDELNMVTCEVANALFGIETKIARVRNRSYLDPRWTKLFTPHHINLDYIISPEYEVAKAVSRSLTVPGAIDIISLSDDKVKLVAVRCMKTTPLINTPISHFTSLFSDLEISVVGLMRGEKQWIPSEKEIIQEGDKLYFATATENLSRSMIAFGHEKNKGGRLLILGGGNVGLRLAEEIEKNHPDKRALMIEKDPIKAACNAEILSNTIVLCGDALDREVLLEAGVHTADTVVAVTADDRVNALSSLLAKRHGAKRSLALINSNTFEPLVSSLGVDAIINPRKVTVSKILQFINRQRLHSVHSLGSDFGEVMEMEASENSGLVGLSAQEINEERAILLAAIVREGEVHIPRQSTVVQVGDRIVLMVSKNARSMIEKKHAAIFKAF